MSEAIEVQPQPILGVGQIDLAKGPLSLADQCSSTTKKTAKRALFSVNSRKMQSFNQRKYMNKTAQSFMQKTVSKKGSGLNSERGGFDVDEKESVHDSDDN